MSTNLQDGSGGLVVTQEMQSVLNRPGFIPIYEGGQPLRVAYRRRTLQLAPELLHEFARACFNGALETVKTAVEAGTAPDLGNRETPYKFGYAVLVLFGAQRPQLAVPGGTSNHLRTLKFLLTHGAPPNTPDLVGCTALHHACAINPRADIARVLLEHGADPDAQDRFGLVPLMGAFQNNAIDAINVLMEFGARLDLVDGDGYTADTFFIRCGPKVTAAMQKCKRKREGRPHPLDEEVCAVCREPDAGPLKFCSKCHATWYCSQECQVQDWATHKRVCRSAVTATVKPFYSEEHTSLMPMDEMRRRAHGFPPQEQPPSRTRAVQIPDITPGGAKKMIIKIQVPQNIAADAPPEQHVGALVVYDKKRTFACWLRKEDDASAYMQVSHAVRTKGVGGAKAYFSAEMKSPDALVIKVSEVLAEQPF